MRQRLVDGPTCVAARWRAGATAAVAGLAMLFAGCESPGNLARIRRENDALRQETKRLKRAVRERSGRIAALDRQVKHLKRFGPDQPADLFSPVKVVILSRSGGADYDGEPGDDGVTVHLQPIDGDGDAVKAPGKITIQLLDNAILADPKRLGLFVFATPEDLRRLWLSQFATHHYTLKCPLPPDARPRASRITVSAEFVDYLTGKTLTAVKEVPFDLGGG